MRCFDLLFFVFFFDWIFVGEGVVVSWGVLRVILFMSLLLIVVVVPVIDDFVDNIVVNVATTYFLPRCYNFFLFKCALLFLFFFPFLLFFSLSYLSLYIAYLQIFLSLLNSR